MLQWDAGRNTDRSGNLMSQVMRSRKNWTEKDTDRDTKLICGNLLWGKMLRHQKIRKKKRSRVNIKKNYSCSIIEYNRINSNYSSF